MLLVGLMLPLGAIVLELLVALGSSDWSRELSRALWMPAFMTSNLMITMGAIELARRTQGIVRAGAVVAAITDIAACALLVSYVVITVHARVAESFRELDVYFDIYKWVSPILGFVGIAAFAIAAGRKALGVGITAIVLDSLIFPIPPINKLIWSHVELGRTSRGFLTAGLLAGQALLVAILGGYIAARGREPRRIAARAVRGFRWLSIAAVAGAGAALVLLVHGTSMAGDASIAIAVAGIAAATWWIARAQLATLSPALVHVALAFALATAIGFGAQFAENYPSSVGLARMFDPDIPWWLGSGGVLAIAWLVVVLALYGRRSPAVMRAAQLCGIGFTIAAGLGIAFHEHPSAFATCNILAYVIVIPLFRVAAREVAADPVQTMADVFA
jgi:hypothetical protein